MQAHAFAVLQVHGQHAAANVAWQRALHKYFFVEDKQSINFSKTSEWCTVTDVPSWQTYPSKEP